MPIAGFFVVLAGALAIAILYPHLRVMAIAVVVFMCALLGYLFFDMTTQTDRRVTLIDQSELRFDALDLRQDSRFSRLAGRVTNTSDTARLRDFSVTVHLMDCETPETPRPECATIAEDTGIARVDLPAGQTRAFEVVLSFRDTPDVTGVLVWDHTISDIHATP